MSKTFGNGIDLQGQRARNVGDPSVGTDAANRNYVDNALRGLSFKMPARLAPTGNINLASPGTSFDGKTAANGDTLLLMNQTAGAENGLWIFQGGTTPLVRRNDADNGTELQPGTAVTVTEGTTNGDKLFQIISDAPVTIGTTATSWAPVGGGSQAYTASNGVQITGANITGVAKTGGGLVVASDGFAIDTTVVARKAAGNMGNGSLTSIPVTHNLGTKDVVVSVRLNSNDEEIIADWVATDVNTVTFTFPNAPAAGFYRFVILG